MVGRFAKGSWSALLERGRLLCSRENLAKGDAWLRRFGVLIVLVFAVLYYGQYYRSGLNLAGEGGTEGVIALRLMEGQKPIVDTFLGYNVMWFYPIVWLFQIVGPNYVALRIYFFVICAGGGVLAFLMTRRSTGCGLYALGVASLVILMPGMIFRNYMPFLGLLNMFCLSQAYVFAQPCRGRVLLWMALAGLALGLTYLLRIELGFFFSIITVGLAILYPIGFPQRWRERLGLAALGLAMAVAMVFLTHLPVYLDARARGFDRSFVGQYQDWFKLLRGGLHHQVAAKPKPASPQPAVAPAVGAAEAAPAAAPKADKNVRLLPPISEAWTLPDFYDRAFVLITYLPILVSVLLLGVGGVVFLISLWKAREWKWEWEREREREISLTILTALGCALTLYPQFLFFRPDTPHLSEFMAPFLVALGCAVWHGLAAFSVVRNRAVRVLLGAVAAVCLLNAALYTYHTMPKESGGTIAAARKKTELFKALNGVDVYLSKKEIADYQAIFDAVIQNSEPGEYVVCYPYAPTINFMADRPSFEHNLYVDNASAPAKFHEETLREIEKFKPALILIDNRDINNSDSSRFAVWAAKTYEHIRSTYRHLGTFRRQEIYVRETP